jgi:mutator protein MutT
VLSRLYPDRPIIGVGAVIICDSRILLEKRKNDPERGKWSIPGGIVELGESLEQTVIREVKEETGLVVDKPELIDVVDRVTFDERGKIKYHFVIIDFSTVLHTSPESIRASSDALELKWVRLAEVENYNLTKSFREFFRKNEEKLSKVESCK